jgi:hypothetical protein
VEGKAEDWFVYKVPRQARGSGAGAGTDTGLGLMQDTVNVGRHTITEVMVAWLRAGGKQAGTKVHNE